MDTNSTNEVAKNIRKTGIFIVLFYLLIVVTIKLLEVNNFIDYSLSSFNNEIFDPPSLKHLCGTDRLGRDVCLRTLQGTSISRYFLCLKLGAAIRFTEWIFWGGL